MDLSCGTPQQISDYKRGWLSNSFSVRLHSDLDWKGKDWCRRNTERWNWSFSKFTGPYEHTFHFNFEEDAIEFKEEFGRFANV